MKFDKVNDSGERQEFNTGSRRDTQKGKGRPDLIPIEPLLRLAKHYENGAVKYGDHNWQKGQPLSRYYSSAQRHLWAFMQGDVSEDHLSAVVWNVFCIIHHIEAIQAGTLSAELDDIGAIKAIEKGNKKVCNIYTCDSLLSTGVRNPECNCTCTVERPLVENVYVNSGIFRFDWYYSGCNNDIFSFNGSNFICISCGAAYTLTKQKSKEYSSNYSWYGTLLSGVLGNVSFDVPYQPYTKETQQLQHPFTCAKCYNNRVVDCKECT